MIPSPATDDEAALAAGGTFEALLQRPGKEGTFTVVRRRLHVWYERRRPWATAGVGLSDGWGQLCWASAGSLPEADPEGTMALQSVGDVYRGSKSRRLACHPLFADDAQAPHAAVVGVDPAHTVSIQQRPGQGGVALHLIELEPRLAQQWFFGVMRLVPRSNVVHNRVRAAASRPTETKQAAAVTLPGSGRPSCPGCRICLSVMSSLASSRSSVSHGVVKSRWFVVSCWPTP